MIQKVFVLPCSEEFDHDNNGNAVMLVLVVITNRHFSLYSNSDLRRVSVFASPALSRRRNVYTHPEKFWMLREKRVAEEDPSVVSKISQLQQRVCMCVYKHQSISR